MRFVNEFSDEVIEVNREIKVLKLVTVRGGDYFKGKPHDNFYFEDEDGKTWIYACPMTANQCDNLTKIGQELAFKEGETFKISGYFIDTKDASINEIYRPRLLKA